VIKMDFNFSEILFGKNVSVKKEIEIVFADKRLKRAYDEAKNRNPILYDKLTRAFNRIRENPEIGAITPKRWLSERKNLKYLVLKYGINNLRVFDISDKERLLYSLIRKRNKIVVKIIALMVWWGTHKQYERLFGY